MKKLKIGIIGVGRLGYEHACNIANRVPGSELVAICLLYTSCARLRSSACVSSSIEPARPLHTSRRCVRSAESI